MIVSAAHAGLLAIRSAVVIVVVAIVVTLPPPYVSAPDGAGNRGTIRISSRPQPVKAQSGRKTRLHRFSRKSIVSAIAVTDNVSPLPHQVCSAPQRSVHL